MFSTRRSRSRTLALVACLALGAVGVTAAEFKTETQKAWSTYVQMTEGRIARELGSADRFLVLDFGPSAAADRAALGGGQIVTRKIETADPRGQDVDVPSGMVHHWTGAVLVPGVRLDTFLSQLRSTPPETFQKDVVRSAILERGPDTTHTFLRVQRTKIVTVVDNTEHVVAYRRESATHASSSSHAMKIAELENANSPGEREKPQGQDHGFLWGWNSYSRYRESMERTLGAIRTQFGAKS